MGIKEIGNLRLPVIGQGAGGNDKINDSHRIKIIRAGVELGMTLIDTAEAYQEGYLEEIVGRAIVGLRDKVFISTKFSPIHNDAKGVRKAAEGSLRRLGVDHVDLYQIHWPNPSIHIEETMDALGRLKREGKIKHIGVSNFSLKKFTEAQKVSHEKIESNQLEYNLVERGAEFDFFPYSEKNQILVIAYTPLLVPIKNREFLESLAQKYRKTTRQVILNWLISHKTVVPIPRTLDFKHLRDNAVAADFEMNKEDILEISDIFSPKIIEVLPSQIKVLPSLVETVYTTLEEALKNSANLTPSPFDLAKDVLGDGLLKPVQLIPTLDKSGKYKFDLIGGRLRYWAWVIAHNGQKPIPAYVRENL